MAGIIINILLNKKIKNKQELFSILNHCLLEKDIHFFNAFVYRPEQEDSENINSIEEWLDISYKNGYMNQSEFLCEGKNIRVYSVKINEKMGLEIYIPYDFFNELYSLEEKNIEFLKQQMLDLMKSNIIITIFQNAYKEKISVKKFLGYSNFSIYKIPILLTTFVIAFDIVSVVILQTKVGILFMIAIGLIQLGIFYKVMISNQMKKLNIFLKS